MEAKRGESPARIDNLKNMLELLYCDRAFWSILLLLWKEKLLGEMPITTRDSETEILSEFGVNPIESHCSMFDFHVVLKSELFKFLIKGFGDDCRNSMNLKPTYDAYLKSIRKWYREYLTILKANPNSEPFQVKPPEYRQPFETLTLLVLIRPETVWLKDKDDVLATDKWCFKNQANPGPLHAALFETKNEVGLKVLLLELVIQKWFALSSEQSKTNHPAGLDLFEPFWSKFSESDKNLLLIPELIYLAMRNIRAELRKIESRDSADWELLDFGDALFQTRLVQDIVSSEEYKEACFGSYMQNVAPDVVYYGMEHLFGRSSAPKASFKEQSDHEQSRLLFFNYFALRSIVRDSRGDSKHVDPRKVWSSSGQKDTSEHKELWFLGQFVSACRATFEFVSTGRIKSAPFSSAEWKQQMYRGQPAWSTEITDQKTMCFTEFRKAWIKTPEKTELKYHDIFVIKVAADEGAIDSLLREGIVVDEEHSTEFHYLLKILQCFNADSGKWFYNSLELKNIFDPDQEFLRFEGPEKYFGLMRVDINQIKKDTRLLVYEKVHNTC